jgi:hypothetical protein
VSTFLETLKTIERRHAGESLDIEGLTAQARAALYYHSAGNVPGKEPPTYEQLTRSLEIARREISISYETRNYHEEQVKIETVLKCAAAVLGTEAKGRIAQMVRPWKITEDQAVGKIDRRAIQKLKKLKAFD